MQRMVLVHALSICIAAHAASRPETSLTPSKDALAFIQASNRQLDKQQANGDTEGQDLAFQDCTDISSTHGLFTPNAEHLFNIMMRYGYLKAMQRHPSIATTAMATICQEFHKHGLVVVATLDQRVTSAADEQERSLVESHPKVQHKLEQAVALADTRAALTQRVLAWAKFNNAFNKAHKTYMKDIIPNFKHGNTIYKIIVNNSNLTRSEAVLCKMSLIIDAIKLSRIEEHDPEACHELLNKYITPVTSAEPAPEPSPLDSILEYFGIK